jgi:hypothetical protein
MVQVGPANSSANAERGKSCVPKRVTVISTSPVDRVLNRRAAMTYELTL